jgi:hypothetical protein
MTYEQLVTMSQHSYNPPLPANNFGVVTYHLVPLSLMHEINQPGINRQSSWLKREKAEGRSVER